MPMGAWAGCPSMSHAAQCKGEFSPLPLAVPATFISSNDLSQLYLIGLVQGSSRRFNLLANRNRIQSRNGALVHGLETCHFRAAGS